MSGGQGAQIEGGIQSLRAPASSITVRKFDDDEQIVMGEVYAPDVPDSQGDFMTRASIQKMAYEFMRKGLLTKIDTNHSREESGSYVVESFIARDDDTLFIPGSWVLGVKVPDQKVWNLIKSGEINGFSFDGEGFRVESHIEIDIPDTLHGETDQAQGHSHSFKVSYKADGSFRGGKTGPGPDGHTHPILRGTLTEEADGHAHRFSFVEGVLSVETVI